MRFTRTFVLAFFSLISILCLATSARAQITNVTADQAPLTPGVGHDYIHFLNETVSPAIGSVSIRINLPVPSGREITIPFAFTYDSNAADHRVTAGAFSDNLGYLARGGWTYAFPRLTDQTHNLTWKPPGPNFPYTCSFRNSFILMDLKGATHSLSMAAFQANNNQNCVWPSNGPPPDILIGGDDYVQSTATAHTGLPVRVADADGTVYYFSGINVGYFGTGEEYLPDWLETRNGNRVTFTNSGSNGTFSVTDTAGRTLIASSGFGASGNAVTVAGSNAYTVTWGLANFNISYSFQTFTEPPLNYSCGGASPTYSQPEITAITLPNGQSYQFQYDPSAGLLSKIIYPSLHRASPDSPSVTCCIHTT